MNAEFGVRSSESGAVGSASLSLLSSAKKGERRRNGLSGRLAVGMALVGLGIAPVVGDPFVNLTFDEPTLAGPFTPLYPGGPLEGDAQDVLTGWDVFVNGELQTKAIYSPIGSGAAGMVNLYNSGAVHVLGLYSVALRSPFPGQPDVRIRQTGTIPEEMTHLWIASSGYIQAFADGVKVGEVSAEGSSWAFLDVSAYRGREVQLEFALPPGGTALFDIVGFTVPEPSTWALLGFGAAALGVYRKWRSG